MTLDEYFSQFEATRFLRQNLEANIEALADELDQESKDALMRTNLIMIRQCLQDFGI